MRSFEYQAVSHLWGEYSTPVSFELFTTVVSFSPLTLLLPFLHSQILYSLSLCSLADKVVVGRKELRRLSSNSIERVLILFRQGDGGSVSDITFLVGVAVLSGARSEQVGRRFAKVVNLERISACAIVEKLLKQNIRKGKKQVG